MRRISSPITPTLSSRRRGNEKVARRERYRIWFPTAPLNEGTEGITHPFEQLYVLRHRVISSRPLKSLPCSVLVLALEVERAYGFEQVRERRGDRGSVNAGEVVGSD